MPSERVDVATNVAETGKLVGKAPDLDGKLAIVVLAKDAQGRQQPPSCVVTVCVRCQALRPKLGTRSWITCLPAVATIPR